MKKINRHFKGIWIPRNIWENKKLSIQEKVMIVEIESLTNNENKYCWASNKYFSEFFCLSKGRVSTIINNLFRKGFLSIKEVKQGKKTIERRIKINYEHFDKTMSKSDKKEDEIDILKTERRYSENVKESNTIIIIQKDNISKDISNVSDETINSEKPKNVRRCLKRIKKPKNVHRCLKRIKKPIAKKIRKKKTLLKDKNKSPNKTKNKSVAKSKYKITSTDKKYLTWIYNEFNKDVTVHGENTKVHHCLLDKIHSLFAHNCKRPYLSANNCSNEFIYKEWTIDELFDTFQYHLLKTKKNSFDRIKSFGKFILCEGFKNGKPDSSSTWSPLISWYMKMNKLDNDLNKKGEILYKSMKHNKIKGYKELESLIYNSVAEELDKKKERYCLFTTFGNDSDINESYPLGIVSCFVKYVKERCVDTNFRLVYIRGKKFIPEFIENFISRNAIKIKRRSSIQYLGRVDND